jgi:hypothetical protein
MKYSGFQASCHSTLVQIFICLEQFWVLSNNLCLEPFRFFCTNLSVYGTVPANELQSAFIVRPAPQVQFGLPIRARPRTSLALGARSSYETSFLCSPTVRSVQQLCEHVQLWCRVRCGFGQEGSFSNIIICTKILFLKSKAQKSAFFLLT